MLVQTLLTVAILVLVVLVRSGVTRLVAAVPWVDVDGGRRSIVVARNLSLLGGVLAVTVVWSDHLRSVGVTLVAVAVAVVIAAQDLIRSAFGALVRTTSTAFAIGDQIVVGGIRGYVIDSSVMSTTLLEIGPGHLRTGRTVVIPNSQFLTETVINETAGHRYILHSFTVVAPLDRWRQASAVLLGAAEQAAAPYLEPARLHMEARAQQHSLTMPIVAPLVLGAPSGPDLVELTVRVPVAAQDVWQVEHEITSAWLATVAPGPGSDPGPAVGAIPNRRTDDQPHRGFTRR